MYFHVVFYLLKKKVKVTHKKLFFSRQTVGVFKKVGKLIEKHSQMNCSFCWVEGGRYKISWLVACCMLESAVRFPSRVAQQERTMRLVTKGLVTKAMQSDLALKRQTIRSVFSAEEEPMGM